MALASLVYASRVDPLVRSAGDVGDILESARRHNTADDITGMLAFNGYYFMQCLEGERKAVNSTFRRISADRRHTDVTLMSVRETAKRSFGSWAMGYVPDQEATRQLLLKYGESDAFDPLSIPAENLDQLLIDMSRSLSVALVGCAQRPFSGNLFVFRGQRGDRQSEGDFGSSAIDALGEQMPPGGTQSHGLKAR